MYALGADELDITPVSAANATVKLSGEYQNADENYEYVAAWRTDIPNARYIIYQKHSPKFAGNIHCEAKADDDEALWLCEKGLHGTEVTGGGSIQGSDYKTYLLAGSQGDATFASGDDNEGEDENEGNQGLPSQEPTVTTCPGGATVGETFNYGGNIATCTKVCDSNNQNCTYKWISENSRSWNCYAHSPDNPVCAGVTFTGNGNRCEAGDNHPSQAAGCANTTYEGYGGLCYSLVTDGCVGSVFKGKASYCLADATYTTDSSCAGSSFEGEETLCVGKTENGCANSTFSGVGSKCEGKAANACAGSVFKAGTYCFSQKPGGCDGTIYESGAYCTGYADSPCPAGSPAPPLHYPGKCWDGAGNTVDC